MQGYCKPKGSGLNELHLRDLRNKVQNQAEWVLAKVHTFIISWTPNACTALTAHAPKKFCSC